MTARTVLSIVAASLALGFAFACAQPEPVNVQATVEAVVQAITPVPTSTPASTATPAATAEPVDVRATAQAVVQAITPVPTSTPAATSEPVDVRATAQAVVQAITPVPTSTPASTATPAATAEPVDVRATAQAVVQAITPVPTSTPAPTATPASTGTEADIVEMIDTVKMSVVTISTAERSGTGFTVDSEGHIFTAAHVIAGASSVEVYVDNRWRPATVVGVDEQFDTAILKIAPPRSMEPLAFAEDASTGETVFVVGHQFGAYSEISVVRGVVSDYPLIDGVVFLQTDAAVNLGTSGAPVVNIDGEVVGMIVSRAIDGDDQVAQGVNYATRHSDLAEIWETRDDLRPQPVSTPTTVPTVAPTPATTLVYGPVDEEEGPFLEKLVDGIFEFTLRNPSSSRWRHLFFFRGGGDKDYVLLIRQDRKIFLWLNHEDDTQTELLNITSRHVASSRNGKNTVRVEMRGGSGQLWVNGQWVSLLDLSDWREPGWFLVFSYDDDGEDPVIATKFDDLRVWKFN